PLLEVIGPAHRAHAHAVVGQRDHPHPAVLEAVDADVARVFATAARGMAESAEQRRALVLAIPALELVLRREEGIAAAGVDQVTRLDRVLRAVVGMHLDPRLA